MVQNLISAIDIRPDKIICLVSQELQIVNQGKILQLIGTGMSKLPIDCIDPFNLNKKELLQHLSNAIEKAEKDSSTKIKHAYVNISDAIHSEYVENRIELNNEIIEEGHIKSFFRTKDFKQLYTKETEPLHSFPISYRVNDSKSVSDPIHLRARELKVKWHNIIAQKNHIRNIYDILNEVDIRVKQIVISNYASSLAVLNEMESSLGAITVDIGKVKTSLAFILDNQLIAFDEISLGTYNFSKDLSQIFTISINDAELLRKKMDKLDFTKEINKKDVESFKVYESRAKELINLIFYQIKKSKFHSLVNNNIILTGYGSRSLLINKMIKNKFNLSNCRLGSSQKINGIKLVTENPSLSSSFGLLSYAADHDLELDGSNNFEKKESIFSIIYNFFKAI